MPSKRTAKPKRKTLITKLDRAFSIYIRASAANRKGQAKCFTCDRRTHWRQLQCGHFMSRQYYAMRWDELNAYAQCRACNLRSGEQYTMGKRINCLHGEGTAEKVQKAARKATRFRDHELIKMLAELTAKAEKACQGFH